MKKKNLLFVFADQWRRSALGYAQDEPVHTPAMDRFAETSAYFTNAVSTAPLCSPARASLLTGKHPFSTGLFTNCKIGFSHRLQDHEICISDVLQQEGYQTGYIGKWHLDEPEQNHTPNPISKAERWDAYTPPGPRRHGFDFWYSYGAWDNHKQPHYWQDTTEKIAINQWSPCHETDVALSFLEKRGSEKPFCLFLSWNPPHSPYDSAPKEYWDLYPTINFRDNVPQASKPTSLRHHTHPPEEYTASQLEHITRGYYAAISGLDAQLQRLIDFLETNDLLQDTVVVLTADHGDMLGSHGLLGKHVWYEESIGIPCIIGGAQIPPSTMDTVFGSPDFAPTLLGLLEQPIPSTMEGQDCSLSILQGRSSSEKACYIAASPGTKEMLEAFSTAGLNPADFGWRAVRTIDFLYVVEVGYTTVPHLQRRLYSLKEDPYQLQPTVLTKAPEAGVEGVLENKLMQWMLAQEDGFLRHIIPHELQ